MKRYLIIYFFLTLFFIDARAQDLKSYFGVWRIESIVDYAKIASVNDNQAKFPIHHYFIISDNSTRFVKQYCKADYHLLAVNPEINLQREYGISNQTLKLPNPVLLLDSGCEFIYLLSSKQMIVEKSGVFYRAIKE